MDYHLRRSAPNSIKPIINNYIYGYYNPYGYMTSDYYDYSGFSGFNTEEFSPYSQTTVELPSNYANNISNEAFDGSQGYSSKPQNDFSQAQGYSSKPQGHHPQPQGYSSHPQDYSTSYEYNNANYQQYNYGNYNNNQNNNYNYNNYYGSGDTKYYDQYGNIIKKEKNPRPNNFNQYYQGQNKNESYPYNLNNNQNHLIQNIINKTAAEQNQYSEEQINKWLQEAEIQNNPTNINIKAPENQNNKNYSNTYNINTNANNNTIQNQNQNTQAYNTFSTYGNYDNNILNINTNINSNNTTSTNNINNNNTNNSLKNNTNINNQNNNNTNNTNQLNNNIKINPIENNLGFLSKLPKNNLFFTIGLYNIGSTCYMNATLQCLIHVSPLISYFTNLYPKDGRSLKKLNDSIQSQGYISNSFFQLIKSIYSKMNQPSLNNTINDLNPKTSINDITNSFNKAVSPENFQKTLGRFNPQFKNLEANDSKDLILYLLQVMHQELNYYSKNTPFNGYPNQYNRAQTYQAFVASYDKTNYSIISDLFYGTYENVTKCAECNLYIYNFQKFEFLSFGVSKYHGKEFNIMNGFDDYTKKDQLTGDNQYYCNKCKKLCDAEIQTQLIVPPKHLLINIDYGKNKKYMPSSVKFDEEIDITKYVNYNYNKNIKYRIIGVCSHLGDSGISGHYIAFCKNSKNGKWYKFNDAIVSECSNHSEIRNYGTPYLLLYEKIN